MIICNKCQHINPMGTIFCHACGQRITVQAAEVMQAVNLSKQTQLDSNVYYWGRNAVSLCTFLLAISIILDFILVPPVPPADFPALPMIELFKDAKPPDAAPEKTDAPADNAHPIAAPAHARLTWRQQQGTFILGSLGLDLGHIRQWQQSIVDQQAANGSFPGGNQAAATALAALALQAYPTSDAASVAATRARAYLAPMTKSLIGMEPVPRSLVIQALLDADELDKSVRDNLGLILVDGSAPEWQATTLPLIPANERPAQIVALTGKLSTPTWNAFWSALGAGLPTAIEPKIFSEDAAKGIAVAEDRFFWALASWNYPLAPRDLASVLKTWSGAAPAPASPALAKTCGKIADAAMAVLTVTAPIRVPALALNPSK